MFSPALPDYLAMDPTRLLPDTQYPVWDLNDSSRDSMDSELSVRDIQAFKKGLEWWPAAMGHPRLAGRRGASVSTWACRWLIGWGLLAG